MERDFKGVWIPKEIWLNEELTLMEKCFLTEIDSLDREQGCFASNQYFADFFHLKITRTSQIINSLIKKGYVNARYERKGKQIVKRVLTTNCKKVFNKLYEGIREIVRTPLINCKENNTINNTYNNNESFNQFWELYDKKVSKSKAENLWNKIKPSFHTTIFEHIKKYKEAQPDKQYRKNPDTYLRNKCWNDEIINKFEKKESAADQMKRLGLKDIE